MCATRLALATRKDAMVLMHLQVTPCGQGILRTLRQRMMRIFCKELGLHEDLLHGQGVLTDADPLLKRAYGVVAGGGVRAARCLGVALDFPELENVSDVEEGAPDCVGDVHDGHNAGELYKSCAACSAHVHHTGMTGHLCLVCEAKGDCSIQNAGLSSLAVAELLRVPRTLLAEAGACVLYICICYAIALVCACLAMNCFWHAIACMPIVVHRDVELWHAGDAAATGDNTLKALSGGTSPCTSHRVRNEAPAQAARRASAHSMVDLAATVTASHGQAHARAMVSRKKRLAKAKAMVAHAQQVRDDSENTLEDPEPPGAGVLVPCVY